MNVIITGSAGFLGSHLAAHYLSRGDRVVGIDNFSSSSRLSRHHKQLVGNHNYFFLRKDIADDYDKIGKYLDGFHPELILNFACPASPPIYQKIPVETMMTCTYGVKNMLDVALKHGARIVHASTSEVYGDPDVSPQSESYRGNVNCWGPRSNYDEGKRVAESFIYEYRKLGLDARVVRIFNTYGPHMDPNDGRVVSNLLTQSINGEKLTIYGDGSQTRSFCYVDDLIRGIVALAEVETAPDAPVNIGNPNEFTIKELAQQVNALVGKELEITHMPFPQDDPKQRRPDITKAKELLSWEPQVQLAEGLAKTYNYFLNVLK